jgi:hypothetical protein
MKLYINKGVSQMPNVGTVTPTEDQSIAEHDSSYARRPVGVAEGESYDPDHPEVGKKWKHSDEDSVVEEVKEKQKKRTAEAKADGVVKNFFALEPHDKTKKSLELLKNLNTQLQEQKLQRYPNPREQEFLREVLGYSQEEIIKGLAVITGPNRRLFSKWLCDRLQDSTEELSKSLGVNIGR